MTQKIEKLSLEELTRIEAQRNWVRKHYSPESEHQYETLSNKLLLLQTILKNNWIEHTETLKLQCLGIAFGDALAQKLGLSWVAVEDEWGRDPALIFDGTSIIAFPLTSISKRIEQGEEIDIYNLFEKACEKLCALKQQAEEHPSQIKH